MRIEVAPEDDAVRAADARRGRERARVLGDRHRHRHPRGQAAPDLRGVPAGRRDDVAQVRRHGPRPLDQPRDRAPARRRDPRHVRARQGQHVHALPAGELTSPPTRRRPRWRRSRRGSTTSSAKARRSSPRARRCSIRRRALDLDPALLLPSEVDDDRDDVQQGDRVVLIVEDDATFARTVLDVARERGFKGIVALRGDSGLALAHEFKPDAIVLDMNLPVMDGWTVLDHLKHHPATRHIPVHIVSGSSDEADERAARRRGRVPPEADREGEPRLDARGDRRRSSTAASGACSSSRTTTTSGTRSSSSSAAATTSR